MIEEIRDKNGKLVCKVDTILHKVEILQRSIKTIIIFKEDGTVMYTSQ